MKQLFFGLALILGFLAAVMLKHGGPYPYGGFAETFVIGAAIVLGGGLVVFLGLVGIVTFFVPPSVKDERKQARADGERTLFK